jgi:hypothetical protein
MIRFQIFRRVADGTWKPVRGFAYTVLASAERCVERSREQLVIRRVR